MRPVILINLYFSNTFLFTLKIRNYWCLMPCILFCRKRKSNIHFDLFLPFLEKICIDPNLFVWNVQNVTWAKVTSNWEKGHLSIKHLFVQLAPEKLEKLTPRCKTRTHTQNTQDSTHTGIPEIQVNFISDHRDLRLNSESELLAKVCIASAHTHTRDLTWRCSLETSQK